MTRRHLIGPMLLGLAFATSQACGGDDAPDHPIQRSSLTHQTHPQVTAADLDTQVASNTNAALDLFRRSRVSGENTFIAPYSISSAVAMLRAAAAGKTAQEIDTALRFVLPQKTLHPTFNSLNLALESRGQGSKGASGGDFALDIANALWIQQNHRCGPSFLDTLAVNYGAGVHELDFAHQHESARKTINAWIAKGTHDRIPELLHQGDVDAKTLFVLTNAVYFNGAWRTPFDEKLTRQLPFHAPTGDKPVDTMSGRRSNALHGHGTDYEAISLPYDGDELSMLVILPKINDLKTFEESLDAAKLDAIHANLSRVDVDLTLPTFTFKRRVLLKEKLMAMGMKLVFDANGGAELPGLCDGCTHPIMVTKVIHEAFIKVNEKGAEATGATGIVGRDAAVSMPPEVETMQIDRPFLFVIEDHGTKTVLFVGRVLDPTQS